MSQPERLVLSPMPRPRLGRAHLRAIRGGEVAEWLDRDPAEVVDLARGLVSAGWRCFARTPEGKTWSLGPEGNQPEVTDA